MSEHDTRHTPEHHERPDNWHRRTSDEGVPQEEHASHVSYAWVAAAGATMAVAVILTVVLITVYYEHYVAQLKLERQETTQFTTQAEARRDAAEQQLQDQPAKTDEQDTGTAEEPIDKAMDDVVNEYSGDDADG